MTKEKATLIGLLAILLWSTMVGLVRSITQGIGPVAGAAMIYTTSSIFLLLIVGFPKLKSFPRRYLLIGGLLFAAYEISFSLALAYAHSSRQTLEVGMVNYLWPSLTILFAILFNRQKSNLMVIPGMLVAILGICWVLGGDNGLDVSGMIRNIQGNPLSYALAFFGAIVWASYCTITREMSNGQNGITIFFMLTAMALWANYFLGEQQPLRFDMPVLLQLAIATVAIACGYAAWNTGIMYGHVATLATASYFTPIISSVLTALMLSTPLSSSFWNGTMLVCAGSLLCWFSTKAKHASKVKIAN